MRRVFFLLLLVVAVVASAQETSRAPQPTARFDQATMDAAYQRLEERHAAATQAAQEPTPLTMASEVEALRSEIARLRYMVERLERENEELRSQLGQGSALAQPALVPAGSIGSFNAAGIEGAFGGPSSRSQSLGTASGGTVHVRGYYRKDGTYVRPHTRSAPRR